MSSVQSKQQRFDKYEMCFAIDRAVYDAAENLKQQTLYMSPDQRKCSVGEWRRFHLMLIQVLNRHAAMYEKKLATQRRVQS